MSKINDVRYFFILLTNGDTLYFSVEKKDETYKIYCDEYLKTYSYTNRKNIPQGHSIEFSKDNFVLKNSAGITICSLKEDYHKIRGINNNPTELEIGMLYMDNDLRPILLERGQIICDETAYNIPGILYEPVFEQSEEKSYTKARRK